MGYLAAKSEIAREREKEGMARDLTLAKQIIKLKSSSFYYSSSLPLSLPSRPLLMQLHRRISNIEISLQCIVSFLADREMGTKNYNAFCYITYINRFAGIVFTLRGTRLLFCISSLFVHSLFIHGTHLSRKCAYRHTHTHAHSAL